MNQSPKSVTAAGNLETIGTLSSHKMSAENNEESIGTLDLTKHTDLDTSGIHHPRSLVFELASLVGDLSAVFLKRVPLDLPHASSNNNSNDNPTNDEKNSNDEFSISRPTAIEDAQLSEGMGRVLLKLIELCHALSLNLETVIVKKMALNNKKYPVELCRGKSGKYTKYSHITKITKEEGQSTLHHPSGETKEGGASTETIDDFLASLDRLTEEIGNFAAERLWSRYHKPRNLLLALIGELGELAELFQWKGDYGEIDFSKDEEMDRVGQELADVTIYLIRLADVSNINLKTKAEALLSGGRND